METLDENLDLNLKFRNTVFRLEFLNQPNIKRLDTKSNIQIGNIQDHFYIRDIRCILSMGGDEKTWLQISPQLFGLSSIYKPAKHNIFAKNIVSKWGSCGRF